MSSTTQHTWRAGQQAVIDRNTIVTIERITPTGRIVVGDRHFDSDGTERKAGYRKSRIEPLTAEIQAEMALIERGYKARLAADKLIEKADKYVRTVLPTYSRRGVPEEADVVRVERIIAALAEAMADV